MEIIDRKKEQARLLQMAESAKPELALIYGRRRVGKTYLLTNLWGEEKAFYFSASAVTPEQNRRRLIAELSQWCGETYVAEDYPTWRTVFRLLLSRKPSTSLVVVLDEFQYLAEDEDSLKGVTSELNAVWESREIAGRRGESESLLLVLSGSAVGVMQRLESGSAPLYGRITWRAKLLPFDYLDAALMARFESLRDRSYAYGVFGGMPRYLAPVDASRPLEDNIIELMLAPTGEVRMQVETALLQEEGLRDIPKYQGIMRAIGGGRSQLNEIANHAGLDKHTTVRTMVERLVQLGYVEKHRNFDAGRTTAWRYRLADPAFRFYYEFVTRLESALEKSDAREVWEAQIGPELDRYMGHLFEQIVEQAYYRLRTNADLPLIDEWSRWEGRDRNRESLEMDIVARLLNGSMLTGAIKWNRQPVGIDLHRGHIRDLHRLADSGQGWAHEALEGDSILLYAAAGGFEEGFAEGAAEEGLAVVMWDLADLYRL